MTVENTSESGVGAKTEARNDTKAGAGTDAKVDADIKAEAGTAGTETELSFPAWECEFENIESFTVGDKKKLTCYGKEIREKIRLQPRILMSDQSFKWSLHPLEIISSDYDRITLLVTSYKPGQFVNVNFIVMGEAQSFHAQPPSAQPSIKDHTDHEVMTSPGFRVKSLSWEVQSVIKNKQEPRGFGPSEPIYLPMPGWVWGGLFFVVASVIIVLGFKWMKFWKRKTLMESLASHRTAISPYRQYHREMRQVIREYQSPSDLNQIESGGSAQEYIHEIDRIFKLYLFRQLKIPALVWKEPQITLDIKQRHRGVYKEVGREIRQTLREFEKALKSPEKINILDCNQFHQMSRRVVEQIHKVVKP